MFGVASAKGVKRGLRKMILPPYLLTPCKEELIPPSTVMTSEKVFYFASDDHGLTHIMDYELLLLIWTEAFCMSVYTDPSYLLS